MLTSLQIENFKGFSKLTIEPLAKVNLFVGASNSGKTSVLEAVSVLPQIGGFKLPTFRDAEMDATGDLESWRWMTHNLSKSPIRVTGQRENGPWIFEVSENQLASNLAE